jgi:archaellum component FlaC
MYSCSEAYEVKKDLLNTKAEVEELKAEVKQLREDMSAVVDAFTTLTKFTGNMVDISAKHQDSLQTLAKRGTGVWTSNTHVPRDEEIEPR